MKIGIDIDEVVVEFVKGYLKLYNNKYNKTSCLDDIHSYNFWECLDLTREEAIRLADEYHDSELFDDMELVDGAKEILNKLDKNNELIFITARPIYFKKKTNEFFQKHFGENSFKIIYSGDFHKQGKSKHEICKDLGIDLMIEDNIDYAKDCVDSGIQVFLLNKPWNKKEILHENLIRVNHWNDIIDKISEIKNEY